MKNLRINHALTFNEENEIGGFVSKFEGAMFFVKVIKGNIKNALD